MAKFLRLHIRGIRSVGDEDHNVHKIEFLSPCTLINGPNGTGKTTTIEALNFVTTGQMPTQKKSAFIHSTDVARKTRVDASVTLEFVDVRGKVCTAVRRLVATVGAKNTAQVEEHTLTIKYADGTTHSVSSKVCDFNKAILHHLGVPKAIFKYVIFCHQEESTWPLSEPKELKKRFDEIFQLTKFVKAQERMRKITLDFKKDKQTAAVQQQLYEAHIKEKLSAKQIRDECATKIARGKQKLAELKEWKSEGIRKSEEMKTEIGNLENVMVSLTKNQAELKNLTKQLQLIRVEAYSGTIKELEQEIEDVQMGSEGRNFAEERTKIERKVARNVQEKQGLTKQKTDIESRISSLKAQFIHRESLKKDLEQLEAALREELEIENDAEFDLEIDTATCRKIEKMSQKTQVIVKNAAKVRQEFASAQEEVTKVELEVKNLQVERSKLEGEVDQLKTKIRQGENATTGMKDILKQEETLRKQLSGLNELDEGALESCKQSRESVQKELDTLKKLCVEAEKNSEREREIESSKQSLANSRRKLATFDEKHDSNWKNLFGEKPKAPWAPGVARTCVKLRNDKRSVEEELRGFQLNFQKLETTHQQQKKYEEKLTGQELQLNEEIFEKCSCEPEEVVEKLAETRRKLKKARKDLAPISAKVDLYDTWIENTNSSGCCPLCSRDFSTKREIDEFSQKLQDLTLNFPHEQEELEKAVAKMEAEEVGLVQAEGRAKELERVMKELKEVRAKNKVAMKEIKEAKQQVEDKEEQLGRVNAKIRLVEALQADVGIMDQLSEQIRDDERKLETLSDVEPSGDGRSYNALRAAVEEKEKEFRKVVKLGEDLQKSAGEMNRLQAKINELGSQRVSLGEAAAQTGAFAEQLEKKKQELERCIRRSSEKREEDLPSARRVKEEVTKRLAKIEEELKKAEMEVQLKRKELEQKHDQWNSLVKSVEQSGKCEKDLQEQEQNAKTLNERIEENQQRQKRFEEDLRSINGSQNKQLVLEDQRQRMRIEQKIKDVEGQLGKLEESGVSEEQVMERKREYSELQNEMRNRNNEEVKIYTQVQEFEKQLKAAEAKLSQKEIQRAEVNYRDAILEMTLLEETIEDLTKYRQCLDVSLIQFHTEKMAAVNVIIDELWRKVYNSTDITTIRIRSDAKSETSSRNCAYDYNVMMVQESGAEVEMRGRCSAGQKMLASLLIRIALAEVFGGLCSMIALDEPTTNLDESKVEGMANVLNDLIEARRGYDEHGNLRGREMQMVVITHDERLVNKLTIGCRPEYIYVLGKNEHGVSFLSKRMPNGEEIRMTK